MALTMTGVLTQSGTLSGFTTATWTRTASSLTPNNSRSAVVTAKGGTQPGAVTTHSVSSPFSFMATRPVALKPLPPVGTNGRLPNVPVNSYSFSTWKGGIPLAGQSPVKNAIRSVMDIAAGCDLADPTQLQAMVLAHASWLVENVQAICDAAVTGEL